MNFDKTISELLSVDGALAAAVVDYSRACSHFKSEISHS